MEVFIVIMTVRHALMPEIVIKGVAGMGGTIRPNLDGIYEKVALVCPAT